ncbi:hypothetical protein HOG16_00685 [Candidatus Woesearchaeota archaeon]|nr:hypothetical protein [Candidatus Woesearchaeota archaeon]MBT4321921.1 hypothetical protein [Candidatus Woesearchaeota archaeon]MBT4630616.1 hypothetical protein [Candidatus Woesearchaeota archaeon]
MYYMLNKKDGDRIITFLYTSSDTLNNSLKLSGYDNIVSLSKIDGFGEELFEKIHLEKEGLKNSKILSESDIDSRLVMFYLSK